MQLKDKTAVITGGTRGIGKSIASALAEAGADVVLASRKMDNCIAAAKEIEALGVQALPVRCDLEVVEDIHHLYTVFTTKGIGKIRDYRLNLKNGRVRLAAALIDQLIFQNGDRAAIQTIKEFSDSEGLNPDGVPRLQDIIKLTFISLLDQFL